MRGENIVVHAVGSAVTLSKDIAARITAVTIREGGKATYEVVWWDGVSRKCEWLEACEVGASDGPRAVIGFHGGNC